MYSSIYRILFVFISRCLSFASKHVPRTAHFQLKNPVYDLKVAVIALIIHKLLIIIDFGSIVSFCKLVDVFKYVTV